MIGVHKPLHTKSIIENLKEIIKYKGNFMQIFISNPQQYNLNKLVIDNYKNIANEIISFNKINNTHIIIHSPYTINIAKKINLSNKHLTILLKNLYIAHIINALGVIIHSGKYIDNNINDAINYMYYSIKFLIKNIIKNKWNVLIYFELGSGSGTDIIITENNSLIQFIKFYNKFKPKYKKYLKLCIDTCHIFAAGYDIRNKKNIKKLLNEIKKDIGIENLGLIHLNDSYYEYNSKKDRHCNIGDGKIGYDNLMYFIKKIKKYNIPIMLETDNDYKKMLNIINKL